MMEIIIENDVWCMHKHTPSFASMDRVNMSHTVPVSVTKKLHRLQVAYNDTVGLHMFLKQSQITNYMTEKMVGWLILK